MNIIFIKRELQSILKHRNQEERDQFMQAAITMLDAGTRPSEVIELAANLFTNSKQ